MGEPLNESTLQIQRLIAEIQSIEAQLADRNKQKGEGARFTPRQYAAWRKNALNALAVKLKQLREEKTRRVELLEAQSIEQAQIANPDNPDDLLRACFIAHEQIKERIGASLLPQEAFPVMDAVRRYVLR